MRDDGIDISDDGLFNKIYSWIFSKEISQKIRTTELNYTFLESIDKPIEVPATYSQDVQLCMNELKYESSFLM